MPAPGIYEIRIFYVSEYYNDTSTTIRFITTRVLLVYIDKIIISRLFVVPSSFPYGKYPHNNSDTHAKEESDRHYNTFMALFQSAYAWRPE